MADADTCVSSAQADQEAAMRASLTPAERVATLYEAHRERIYRFLMGQGLEPANAQDLAQDVFIKLFLVS